MDYYGTIGPACASEEVLEEMFREGMTGIRMNLSHGNLCDHEDWIEMIHQAAKTCEVQPRLLIDLQGPELRIGKLDAPVELTEGSEVMIGKGLITIPEVLYECVVPGSELLLDDGKILVRVTENYGDSLLCEVLRGGFLSSGKSIAAPGCAIHIPTLTEDDLKNIEEAKNYGVTGVMLPFVRGAEDLVTLKEALINAEAETIEIFAKLENRRGIAALPELLGHADSYVIARGDLGNDMPLWELPQVQKEAASFLREHGCSFMIVTQMLDSMHDSAVPTRAEVCDIFNAVLDGADSIMLTGETAAGRYPVESMKYLVKTGEKALAFRGESDTIY